MKTSRTWFPLSSLVLFATAPVWAGYAKNGATIQTRDVWGSSGGIGISTGIYSVNFSIGEQIAGFSNSDPEDKSMAGYYAGYLGNGSPLTINRIQAQSIGPTVNGIQIGVPIQGQIEIDLSDQIQSPSAAAGITLSLIQDHMGQGQNTAIPFRTSYDPSGSTIYVNPTSSWSGNSMYQVTIDTGLQNLDGNPLAANSQYNYETLLDPSVENIVQNPVDAGARAKGMVPAAPNSNTTSSLRIDVSPGALHDYSYVLINTNPQTSPLYVNQQAILDANRKAAAIGGPYMSPIAMTELVAYNSQGLPITNLSVPIEVSWAYSASDGLVSNASSPVRPDTLSLYTLDTDHNLWVKLPASQVSNTPNSVLSPVNKLSVFALMGEAAGSASSVYAYPNPWRPHGPTQGTNNGQTGTDDAGITFTNLPSECTIRIYTISGDLVQTIQHSDLVGPVAKQVWNVKTTSSARVASGLYLWEVQSSVDTKLGKLIVIQ